MPVPERAGGSTPRPVPDPAIPSRIRDGTAEVAWNAPYYARLGSTVLAGHEMSPRTGDPGQSLSGS